MKIELVLGDAITKPAKRDVWVLNIKYMHGDADAYTHAAHSYKSEAELLPDLEVLNAMRSDMYCDAAHRSRSKGIAYLATQLPHRTAEDIDSVCDGFHEGDCTNDHQTPALIDDLKVSYFNKDGVEFAVKIFVDGKHRA